MTADMKTNADEQIRVPEMDKVLSPGKLFYNWFAANIGIMGFVYGAIIVTYRLSFLQATLAAFVGALTFGIPGWVAMIGHREGLTTFKLSRAAYGVHGNIIPNFMAWLNMAGWVAVNVITGTLLLQAMLSTAQIKQDVQSEMICLTIFAGLVIASGALREGLLVRIQTCLSWIFGALTLVLMALFLMNAHWDQALSMPSGNWLEGWLPAVAFVASGSSISWSMSAADWGAYVTPRSRSAAVFWSTTMGAAIPLFVMMVGGLLLSTISPDLAYASNPYQIMYQAVPSWFGFSYFLVAAGGLIPQCLISLRSARINLATMGIKISQRASISLHAVFILIISLYVLFIFENFLNSFEAFLNILGICLASWVAIFLMDSVLNRSNGYDIDLMRADSKTMYNWSAIISWGVATAFGFLFTSNAVYRGPLAYGIFYDNSSLAVIISGIAAVIIMVAFSFSKRKEIRNEQ